MELKFLLLGTKEKMLSGLHKITQLIGGRTWTTTWVFLHLILFCAEPIGVLANEPNWRRKRSE